MGTTYTTTVSLCCGKEHKCAGCGSTYAYVLKREVKGQGASSEASEKAASKNFDKALEREVDAQPCPTCGLYQPDMVASRLGPRHIAVFIVAAICLVVLMILHLASGVRDDVLVWWMVGVGGVALALHWVIEMGNLNRNLDANRDLARQRVQEGVIVQQDAGVAVGPQGTVWQPQKSLVSFMVLPLMLAALGLLALPQAMLKLSSWPVNANAYPPVVGPGDETCCYLTEKVKSIKGMWRGSAKAEGRVAGAQNEKFALGAASSTSTWGQNISAKSSEKELNGILWVNLTVPDDPKIVGKEVDCDVQLNVTYPVAQGNSFDDQNRLVKQTMRLTLAPAHAGRQFVNYWWTALLGGGGLVLLIGLIRFSLATGLRKQALPTRVFPLGDGQDEQAEGAPEQQ